MELQFKNISKNFKDKQALKGVNITLNEGIHSLLGPNGAGKSTLMNILVGLLEPTTGEVTFDGKNTVKMGDEFRDVLGFMPQDPGFYPSFSGYALLKYFAELKGIKKPQKRIAELLELVNLTDDSKRKVGKYSGGMKRRLGIAVAMLNDPKILIFDEPTAGLDPKERMRFRNIIGKIGFNKIVILATHIVSDIESISDDILLLKDGELLKFGTPDELKKETSGKVWNVPCSQEKAEEYMLENSTANIKKIDNSLMLRIVSDEKPFENAENAAPDLEDVYMYYFGENATETV